MLSVKRPSSTNYKKPPEGEFTDFLKRLGEKPPQ